MAKTKEYMHTFTVLLKKTEPETTTSVNEANETVSVTKDVVKEVPVELYIQNPSRPIKEEGDMFYSSVFSNCIRRGIFSEAMLSKQFKEIGTTLSEEEKARYRSLIIRYYEVENDIARLSLEKNEEDKKKLIVEQNEIRDELIDFRTAQNALFNNTADTIARNKTILWYILFLSFCEEKGKPVSLFPGADYDEKIASYDKLEAEQGEVFSAAIEELTSFVTFWYLGLVKGTSDFLELKKNS